MVLSDSRVLFYQLGLKQFGSMHKLVLDPPQSLQELMEIAVETEPGITAAGLNPGDVLKVSRTRRVTVAYAHCSATRCLQVACERLLERREMLEEYFSIDIDEEANLCAVPLILPGYTPNLDHLPSFLLCLSFKVCQALNCMIALADHSGFRLTGGKNSNVSTTSSNSSLTSTHHNRHHRVRQRNWSSGQRTRPVPLLPTSLKSPLPRSKSNMKDTSWNTSCFQHSANTAISPRN